MPTWRSRPTAERGWGSWRRNGISSGLCCAGRSASRDRRDCSWLLESASLRDESVGASRTSRRTTMLQKAPMYAYIPASDLARARRFYEEKLGFRPQDVTPGGVVYGFAQETACFLYPTPNAGTSKASQAFWQVEDIEREVKELKSRGVEFERYDFPGVDEHGIVTGGGAKAAWFTDSEGNIMALIQNL